MAVIRVSGYLGSGKTTLCQNLSAALGYRYVYMGQIFRDMAEKKGLRLEEFYKLLASDPKLEKSIDADQEKLMMEEDHLIVEGRMAPFLNCGFECVNLLVKAKREIVIQRLKSRVDYSGKTEEEIEELLETRLNEERKHYKALHDIDDHFDENCFDVLIDTSELPPNKVLQIALSKLKAFGIEKKSSQID